MLHVCQIIWLYIYNVTSSSFFWNCFVRITLFTGRCLFLY